MECRLSHQKVVVPERDNKTPWETAAGLEGKMKRSAKSKRQRRSRRPREGFSQKSSVRSQVARERALAALAAIRRGASLSDAAKENGVTPRTVKRYVGSALVQDRAGGRIRATREDRLVRYLVIPGPRGPIEITV